MECHSVRHKVAKLYCNFSILNFKPVSVELHSFSDISVSAYNAVLYIRTCFEGGEVHVKIIASKIKVGLLKGQDWNLQQLYSLVHTTTRVLTSDAEMHCRTDSTCVLY